MSTPEKNEISMNAHDMYREETFTDNAVGTTPADAGQFQWRTRQHPQAAIYGLNPGHDQRRSFTAVF